MTVLYGALPVIRREAPGTVTELLRRIELGDGNPGDGTFRVRVPLAAPGESAVASVPPLGRQVGYQLRTAIIAAQAAALQADPAAFDDAVPSGVSADLCKALADLARAGHNQAFEISFRWGRGVAADVPADAVLFPENTATAVTAGARRLRRLDAETRPTAGAAALADSGTVAVTGIVTSLHGRSQNGDWLVRIQGDLTANGVVVRHRVARVLLGDETEYDQAITAHRTGAIVQAHGSLTRPPADRGIEIRVDNRDFGMIEGGA